MLKGKMYDAVEPIIVNLVKYHLFWNNCISFPYEFKLNMELTCLLSYFLITYHQMNLVHKY